MSTVSHAPPRDPYDVLAPVYETITAGYDHGSWLSIIERLARRYGLRGQRVLDVACGTGASFLPLVDRGYRVEGCDISQGMLEQAQARVAGRDVPLHQADMRCLPLIGEFDLALCLDDAMNHLLDPDDVARALRAIAANLRVGALLVFDVNTLRTLRDAFSATWRWEDAERAILWRGLGDPQLPSGRQTAAAVTVLQGADRARDRTTVIRYRHHPLQRLLEQLRHARLEPVHVHGQQRGAQVLPDIDELRDDKALLFARATPRR